MLKKIFIITIIILIIYIILRKIASSKKETFLNQNLNKEYIIDVRSHLEWNSWHHPKAIHIPYYQIESIKNIVKNKEDKIILYCQTSRRANIARKKLINMGYKNIEVKNIKQI